MKTLLIFTFFLISGPVHSSDVIGYSGGSVIISCKLQQSGRNNKYFCKNGTDECINVQTENTWVQKERLYLRYLSQDLLVVFRNLSLQDSGSYRCGETGRWSHDVELKVKTDPCCSGPSAVTGFLGETLTINCSSPEELKADIKGFYKHDGQHFTEVITNRESQRNRSSISEDRSSKVVSVRISDVREEDGGVYYCGVWVTGNNVSYYSLFSEIQLQVTEHLLLPERPPTTMKPTASSSDEEHLTSPTLKPTVASSDEEHHKRSPTTMNPTAASPDEEHHTPGSSTFIIIIITVCVTLLLIGGLALIFYKLRFRKTQGSISSPKTEKGNINDIPPSECAYEEIRESRPQDPSNTPQRPEPTTESLMYSSVSFQKNPDSLCDHTVSFSKKESDTEYVTVSHHISPE
ncbi:polymeric immunoglobulin receptor-like [Hoplias malabaricus]|uniref:polymeric immunoglobulin receptor-like n=1 Tax=Hoplias malabaricus TaxID=27720 RepID=UPI0034628E42